MNIATVSVGRDTVNPRPGRSHSDCGCEEPQCQRRFTLLLSNRPRNGAWIAAAAAAIASLHCGPRSALCGLAILRFMNRVVHFEVHAVDLDKMQKFYESVFGWQIEDLGPQMGNYRLVNTGKDEAGAQWPGYQWRHSAAARAVVSAPAAFRVRVWQVVSPTLSAPSTVISFRPPRFRRLGVKGF